MLAASAVAGYLFLWLMLRAMALRLAEPATAAKRSPWMTRIALAYCFLCAVALVVAKLWSEWGNPHDGLVRLSVGIALASAGLLVDAICLRSLSTLYSLEMAIKKNHTVVRTGPYRLVRHPIYFSNILGFIGVCILLNHWAAWGGLAAQVVGFVVMGRREEAFLIAHLGEPYERYCRDVRWMLIPGIM